jgi:hypothetical protein
VTGLARILLPLAPLSLGACSGASADADPPVKDDAPVDTGDAPEPWEPSCASSFTLEFPDGETVAFDGCPRWSLEAGYEYDPDGPPELARATLSFHAWEDAGLQCDLTLELGTVCEPGFYLVGAGSAVSWVGLDCAGVSDANEGSFGGAEGWVWLDAIDTGADAGSFEGSSVRTGLGGSLWARSAEGVVLGGTFTVSQDVAAGASERTGTCSVVQGDLDGDGHPGPELWGTDCDDAAPEVNAAAEERCDDLDNDCDGEVDEAGDPRTFFTDADGDGFGDGDPIVSCSSPGASTAAVDGDCDDGAAHLHPYDSDGDGSLDACGWRQFDGDYTTFCGVDSDGEAVCWGYAPPSGAPPGPFVEVRAGYEHACGIPESGGVVCWGTDGYGQVVSLEETPRQLELGSFSTCILDAAGEIGCWGADDEGQNDVPSGSFEQMSLGINHGCAVDSAGAVTCWGRDAEGQATPADGTFEQVEAGSEHTCAIRSGGGLACWGSNAYGEAQDVPRAALVDLDATQYVTGAVDADGYLGAQGGNYGQGEFDFVNDPQPGYLQIEVGYATTMALRADGLLDCWGRLCP